MPHRSPAPLSCTTSHATVAFNRLHGEDRFVGWLYYGLCFVNGEGRQGDVPAYFIQDKDKVVHRAETVEEALAVMRRLINASPSWNAT